MPDISYLDYGPPLVQGSGAADFQKDIAWFPMLTRLPSSSGEQMS